MESRTESGSRPDVRLVLPEGPPHTSVEIKSVGLADIELDFMRRMAPSLEQVVPSHGMVTLHGLDGAPPRWTPELAAAARFQAARFAAEVPGYPAGLSAATIVAHGSEQLYVSRVLDGVSRAIRQLPPGDECWVALHWGNGAPIDDIVTRLDWTQLPPHVEGITFVGSVVAFPHRDINVFVLHAPRGLAAGAPMELESTLDNEFARLVLARTEASAACARHSCGA